MGLSHNTVRSYVDILSATYMIRALQPWFANTRKRQVKSPKIYLSDSGVLHQLLGLQSYDALLSHPVLGSSWEGFALEQILRTRPSKSSSLIVCLWCIQAAPGFRFTRRSRRPHCLTC